MFTNERIVVLYGSQTGNAQDLAERIWRESKRFYFTSSVKCMNDYNVKNLTRENCVIFVCSTTGQGEEPDNMKLFWKFLLRKNLPVDSLVDLNFAVLGLGDSSYAKFNFAAKRLHKRLLQLGAKPLVPLGLGDDQHDLGYDAATDPWIESLWSKLVNIYPLPSGLAPLDKNSRISPRWYISSIEKRDRSTLTKVQSIYDPVRKSNDFTVTVLSNERTTAPDHFQDVRLIKLKTGEQQPQYCPGDVVVLRPKNLQWQIDEFKSVLKSNGLNFDLEDERVTLSATDPELPLPEVLKQQLSFNELCEEYFDLMAVPRRYTFSILAQLTDSELEKEKCLEFTTAEGQDDLYTYCNRPRRNIVEVLQDFPNATKNLTRDMLFEILPQIKPREFSIASSWRCTPDEIHILLAVVRYKTKLVKERFGMCSNFLADLTAGDRVTAWLKSGSFRFPKDAFQKSVPVIMVGPGTGVAPFRNFILERASDNSASKDNLVLFFGCRNRNSDFHCKDEFLKLQDEGKLTLIPAFSREQSHKIYVQDKIKEHQELVWKMLSNGGAIFVAGSAKFMPQEVREAFVSACQNAGSMDRPSAEKFIETLEKQNKYQTECWS